MRTLKQTPLRAEHHGLGAKMGEFAGWEMPMEYAGVLAEHHAVREAAGMFDLTHLGKIEVAGAKALDLLQRVLTGDVARVEVGAAQYSLALNEEGGIVDDLIVYRLADDRYLVVPNAANTEKVLAILEEGVPEGTVMTHRPDLCTIAVQGPRAPEIVGSMFPEAGGLDYMRHARSGHGKEFVVVARSGYTGERGFEIFATDARPVWRSLLEAGRPLGLEPCGLGARDTLRLEMGYPLHGNDISEERTPLEAGLSWAVALDKGHFRGRDALVRQKEEGIPARLWGLRMEGRLIPRPHYAVYGGEERVGETTSGTFSPTLRVGIALAYLAPGDRFRSGDRVEVDIRGRRGPAEVVKPPFVPRSPK